MTIWQDHERFVDGYLREFEGYYSTGDNGYIDDDGFVFIMGRTDDVINVAGHRLSTGAMEEVLASHPNIAECAVVGINDCIKGQIPLGLICLNAGVNRDDDEIIIEDLEPLPTVVDKVACIKMLETCNV